MGCWNGTCGLTNLPIMNGDKIILFPLVHNKHAETGSGGFCYAGDQFSPVSLPLYGEYDDYGGIENITKNGEIVFSHFMSDTMQRIIEIDEREFNRSKPNDSDVPRDIEELISTFIERGIYKNVGFMMVLESVFEDLQKALVKTRNRYIAQGKEFIIRYKDFLTDLEEDDSKFPYSLHQLWKDDTDGYYNNYFARFWGDNGEGRVSYLFKYSFLFPMASMDDPSQILEGMVDLMLMEKVLHSTRKFWTIQAGAGSQGEEYALLCVLAKSIAKKAEDKVKEMVEDGDWTREEAMKEVYEV